MRRVLIAKRKDLDFDTRHSLAEQAIQRLMADTDLKTCRSIGMYWPIHSEINCRDLMRILHDGGHTVALPVVIERGRPVEFWKWHPGSSMRKGLWDIPVPAALAIPLVGFDAAGYRLGYGGGYYDRTLAAASRKPWCVGLGLELGALPTICPQPHDIRMDVIVTESGVLLQ
jgi:5-formyltetrahydrofolate cyclo-ligase